MDTTSICNLALGRISLNNINDIDTDATVPAQKCRLFYAPTRDWLLRSFNWNFARKPAILSADTVLPLFKWDFQYDLPADYLSLKSVYEIEPNGYEVSGNKILTNATLVQIEYTARIIDPTEFDELFTDLLVLHLALKILTAIGGTESVNLHNSIQQELIYKTGFAKAIVYHENNTSGSSTWNEVRYI